MDAGRIAIIGSIQAKPSQRIIRPRGASTISTPTAAAASCHAPISPGVPSITARAAIPLDDRPQRIEHQGGGGEQRGSDARKNSAGEQPQEDQGDDDHAHERNDERVDERRHQRLLGEDAQRSPAPGPP